MCSGREGAAAVGVASLTASAFFRMRAGILQSPSRGRIEQMNVLRAGGDRNHRAFGRNAFVTDANPHRGACAVEIGHLGVAEVFDEIDSGLESLRRNPE